MNRGELMVWVLLALAKGAPDHSHPKEFYGVFKTQAACEHMLAALSDPNFKLPGARPSFMQCSNERVEDYYPAREN